MRNYFLFVLLIPCFISCRTPRYCYAPSRANVPLLSEKNELQLDGSLPVIRGFDASAAYSLSSHLGVMLNGSWKNDRQKLDGTTYELLPPEKVQYHRSSIDLGIGYFANGKHGLQVECYAGFGKGNFSIDEYGRLNNANTPYTRFYNSKLDRFFIQPAFGVNRRGVVQVAFFARFVFQRYHNLQTDYSTDEMVYYSIPHNTSTFYGFIEPGWLLRVYPSGLKGIGFEYNFMFSGQSGAIPESVPIQMSLGIHVMLSTRTTR